jgi:prepilin-type N-terminal cleavage/methylation domain-containing protein
MTKSSSHFVERGFTLIELLVVMAGIATLLGIAVPAFHRAFERARATKDLNNLRQIGAATQLYMNDNNGAFPGSATTTWMSQLNPKYLSNWRVFNHPLMRAPAMSWVAQTLLSATGSTVAPIQAPHPPQFPPTRLPSL